MVLDASVAVTACLSEAGFDELEGRPLVGPPLLWTEAASVIHELAWRGEISDRLAGVGLERLLSAPVGERRSRDLIRRAREVADELGWPKLYDAHYVALARMLDMPLLTMDGGLRRGASRIVETLGPAEL